MKSSVKYLLLAIVAAIALWSFTTVHGTDYIDSVKSGFLLNDSILTSEFNEQWKQKVNSNTQDLGKLYTENAIKVNLDGTFLAGRKNLSQYYERNPLHIKSIRTSKSIMAVLDSTTVYEIGHYSDSGENEFAHLILWRKADGKLLRELELIAPTEDAESYKPEIDKIRRDWMDVCNSHDTKELVTGFYSNNALYYNHRPMIIGHEAIIQEYSYMNDPNYELTLSPIIFEAVNGSLAFEIGRCSGSYPGNYILVWQKSDEGEWRIFFDSNI